MPKHATTRVVTIKLIHIDDKCYMLTQCACDHYIRKCHLCRHVYCVFDQKPHPNHFHPEFYKSYENNMFSNPEHTISVENL